MNLLDRRPAAGRAARAAKPRRERSAGAPTTRDVTCHLRPLLACLPVLAALGCGTLSAVQLDRGGAESERLARTGDLRAEVDSLARPLVETGQVPGVVVGVSTPGGGRQFFSYGVADKAAGVAPDADTVFAVGSLSKGFLGALTAVLVREGRLSWDDTLEQLLPAEVPLSADARKITVLQLATHTSGLPRQPNTPRMFLGFVRYLFTGESFYDYLDRDTVLGHLADFSAPRQVRPQYSNIGYGLLGYLLELRTGQPLEELLRDDLLVPLGLERTGYAAEGLPGYAQRARGYAGDQPKLIRRGEPVPDWHFTEMMKGAGAISSTAGDLLGFAEACLRRDGTPRGDALVDTLEVRFPRPRGGAAVAWTEDVVDGHRVLYQFGVVGGFTSYLAVERESGIAVVVLQNGFNWTMSVGHRLLLRMVRSGAYRTGLTAHAPDRPGRGARAGEGTPASGSAGGSAGSPPLLGASPPTTPTG